MAATVMFTIAHLSIDNFRTSIRLTADDWTPGDSSELFDVIRVEFEDRKAAADAELAERGYARVGGWKYDAHRDVHVATIAATENGR